MNNEEPSNLPLLCDAIAPRLEMCGHFSLYMIIVVDMQSSPLCKLTKLLTGDSRTCTSFFFSSFLLTLFNSFDFTM